jgi:ribose transport system permease protein
VRKAAGLLALLAGLIALSSAWEYHHNHEVKFLTAYNVGNLLTWVGLFGILSVAQAFVIITGGIDLSVGSVVALVSILAASAMTRFNVHPAAAFSAALALSALIGFCHGMLITKARMQPFVVTLCGLFIYRGIARLITSDTTQGYGVTIPAIRWFGKGMVSGAWLPAPFVIFLLLAAVVGIYLHLTASGRYLFAVGANEQSARFSGISTDRVKIIAYVLCSVVTAIGGLLLSFKVNSMGPSDFGNGYELYAIAGAALGGCSLRGGSGAIVGVVIASALICVLKNLVNILEIPSQLEYVVIGGAILTGVFVDEVFSRKSPGAAGSQ